MSLGFTIGITAESVGKASDEELRKALFQVALDKRQVALLRDEVGNRLIQRQILATSDVMRAVETLTQSSAKLENLTSALIAETANVHGQVVVLTASSHNIERLTKWLIWLTFALGLLTLILVLDVGNKVRLEYFSEPHPPTEPQTPPLPAPQSHQ